MKTFANWMTVIFMIMYWGFRIFITYMFTNGGEYPVKPINLYTEIVVLFITFMCIVLVFKRQRVGGFIYFGINMMYYGFELYKSISNTIADGGKIDVMGSGLDMFASFLGIVMGIVVFAVVALDEGELRVRREPVGGFVQRTQGGRTSGGGLGRRAVGNSA